MHTGGIMVKWPGGRGRGFCSGFTGERVDFGQRVLRVDLEVARRVDDLADDSIGVEDIGDAGGDAAFLVVDAVDLGGFGVGEVAEQGEAESELDRVCAGCEGGVDADAQNLGSRLLELGVEFLEAGEFAGSTAGEGEDVPGEDDGLAAVVGELVLLAVAVKQGEVGCLLSDFERHARLRSERG